MKMISTKSALVIAALVLAWAGVVPGAIAQTDKAATPPPAAAKPAANAPAPTAAQSGPTSAPVPTASVVPAAPAAAGEPPSVAAAAPAKRRSRANEDARRCLDLPTDRAIIKCAEQYR